MTGCRTTPQRMDVPIDDKVSFLQRPEAYPERPIRVDVVETHMSWVFLTESHAYKLKKPVRSEAFDFRSLPARRHNCLEEVRLNRRLAPGIYLGIVPVAVDDGGNLHLGEDGTVVDWLIKMKRLPADRTLEHVIRSGTLSPAGIRRIARILSRFYKQSVPLVVDPAQHRKSFAVAIRAMEATLHDPTYALPAPMIAAAARAGTMFVEQHGVILEQRARDGHIVEAHGDLRPEHVYLLPNPVIVDRLEFSFALRSLDPVDELAYLALECDRLGAAQVGPLLFEAYEAQMGEKPEPDLIAFYKIFRAMVRAKLAVLHIDDRTVGNPEKWRRRATEYLSVACENARQLR